MSYVTPAIPAPTTKDTTFHFTTRKREDAAIVAIPMRGTRLAFATVTDLALSPPGVRMVFQWTLSMVLQILLGRSAIGWLELLFAMSN